MLERDLRVHLELAAQVQQEGAVADLVHVHAVQPAQPGGDRLDVVAVGRVAGNVDHDPVRVGLDHVERGDRAASLADRGDQPARGARGRGALDPDGDRVTGTRIGAPGPGSVGRLGHLLLLTQVCIP